MAENLTPMMRQYQRIKSELPENVILFFRLGDFYEMFFQDAKEAAPILDVALTKRNHVRNTPAKDCLKASLVGSFISIKYRDHAERD